jgi:hypothetical protein
MKISFLIRLSLLTIFFSVNVAAQKAKPNFSGTWQSDEKNSSVSLFGGEMPAKQLFGNCSRKMFIQHNEPELIIMGTSICQEPKKSNGAVRTSETISRYFTDARGDVNNSSTDETIESKTTWKDNKIVITIYEINEKNGKKKPLFYRELSLSKNKENLTDQIVNAEQHPFSRPTFTKSVYRLSK